MYIKNVKIIFVTKLNEDEHKQSHFVHFWGKTLKFLTGEQQNHTNIYLFRKMLKLK